MAAITPKLSKADQALMSALFDSKPEKVIDALDRIPEKGSALFVLPLLKTYVAWESRDDIRAQIKTILYSLKTVLATPELMKALGMKEFQNEKAFILSIFWNAGLIPSELGELVSHAIKGDYLTAFEALTVIELMDETADSEDAREAVLDIEEYFDEHPDADNVEVLQQLRLLLIDYANT